MLMKIDMWSQFYQTFDTKYKHKVQGHLMRDRKGVIMFNLYLRCNFSTCFRLFHNCARFNEFLTLV
jgi:hypothetical protein